MLWCWTVLVFCGPLVLSSGGPLVRLSSTSNHQMFANGELRPPQRPTSFGALRACLTERSRGALYAKGRIVHHHVSADGRELLVTSHPNAKCRPYMADVSTLCVPERMDLPILMCLQKGAAPPPTSVSLTFFNAAHACLPGSVQALRAKGPITVPFQMGVTCAPKPPRFFPAAHVPHIAACGRFICRKIWVVRSSLLCK